MNDKPIDYCRGECSGALFKGELWYCQVCNVTICHDGECFEWHWKQTHHEPLDKDKHMKKAYPQLLDQPLRTR